MSQSQITATRREIRKAFGKHAISVLDTVALAVEDHEAILTRGLFGRLKWLLVGR